MNGSSRSVLKQELQRLKNPLKAKLLSRFFKTGKGEYGEGDIFLGIIVPVQRQIAAEYRDLSMGELEKLLRSPIHEERLIALFILIHKYQKGDDVQKKKYFNFYLKNTKHINNWDLVDLSAPKIVGEYLKDKNRGILYKFARSKNLWERRIAALSTFQFIKRRDFTDSLKIAKILLHDNHDLIHKAVGWMLREIGKRERKTEEWFLLKHYKTMPRTMLRYVIERFDKKKRNFYLTK
jgi:3-methyladenine DNA glycosylase AlkD